MKLIKFSLKYIFQYRLSFIALLVFFMVKAIIVIILPYMSGIFIDCLIEQPTLKIIYGFAIIYGVVALIQILILYFSAILQTYVYSNASIKLIFDMVEHMQNLPISFYTNKDTTYFAHRIQNDSNAVITFVLTNALDFISNILSIGGTFFIIIKVSSHMFIVYIIALIIYLIQYIFTKKRLYSSSQKIRELESNFFSILLKQFKHLKFIKIFNLRENFKVKLKKTYESVYRAALRLQKVMCLFQSNQIIVSTIFKIILLLFGGVQFINGRITIGIFSILLSYIGVIMNSVVYFANLGQSYVGALVCYNRLQELIKLEKESNGTKVIDQINTIEVQSLSYGYNGNLLVRNLNFIFKKGKIYCICGANGVGKTTFCDIIFGLNQEYEGKVMYNCSVDLRELDMFKVRNELCSCISQDVLLYEDTILNNILLNKKNVNIKEIKKLAEQIGLFHERNAKCCLSFDYLVDDNSENLSGGERQKIALLRSFIGGEDLIIYDEPTSYLDNSSVKFFIEKIQEMKHQNKILIIISHDKSLQKFCDVCINLENYKQID